MTNKDYRHKNRSICEMSMLLVSNIIRLSSLSFSGLSFTENLSPPPPPQYERTDVAAAGKGNTTSVSKFSKESERSREPEKIKGPRSYLMKPEKEDPTFVRQEINDVDVNAENYIKQVRGKIGNDASIDATTTAAKRFSGITSSSIVK